MSAHPILDELALFINGQFSMTTGRNRRSWVKAAAILKRHTDELSAKATIIENIKHEMRTGCPIKISPRP